MWLKRLVAIVLLASSSGIITILIGGEVLGVGRPADTSNIQTAVTSNIVSNVPSSTPTSGQTSNTATDTSSSATATGTTPTDTTTQSGTGTNTSAPPTTSPAPEPSPAPTPTPTPSPNPNPTPTPQPVAPVLSFSASPSLIVAGGSSNLSWNTTGTSPVCTASGGWSGNQPASGSQLVSPAITTSYTLNCTNSAGSASQQVVITVTQPVVYCGGKTPCYGPSDMAAHKTSSNCWGFNINVVYNLTAFAPVHPGGSSRIGGPECGNDISGYLNGTKSNNGTHDHSSSTKNNTTSLLLQYKVGYYDASKP